MEHRHPPRALRPDLRSHERRRRRRPAASPPSSCPRRVRASRSSSTSGRSTCRPTTPTSDSPTCGFPTRPSSAARTAGCRSPNTSSTRTASARRRRVSVRPSTASTRPSSTPRCGAPFGKPLSTNQGIQFPARRAAHPVRDVARPRTEDGLGDGRIRSLLRLRQGVDVQLLGQPACAARPPTGPCRCTAAWATRVTCRSNTSTAITVATASPKAARRSRCVA